MNNRLTPWVKSNRALPTREGVYQARASNGLRKAYYSYFDGNSFHGCWFTADQAAGVRWSPGRWYSTIASWRGLAKKP